MRATHVKPPNANTLNSAELKRADAAVEELPRALHEQSPAEGLESAEKCRISRVECARRTMAGPPATHFFQPVGAAATMDGEGKYQSNTSVPASALEVKPCNFHP